MKREEDDYRRRELQEEMDMDKTGYPVNDDEEMDE
jgi:hypothetical protein